MSCATTSEFKVTFINNAKDIPKYIVNDEFTFNWTYCGHTESNQIIIKRNYGVRSTPKDRFHDSFPYRWYKEYWFMIRPQHIQLPKGIESGDKMKLLNGKFTRIPKIKIHHLLPTTEEPTDLLNLQQYLNLEQ